MAELIKTHIYVDADACPVKDEIYKVAKRYSVPVTLVSNSWMRTPDDPNIHLEKVGDGFDEADDWIVDHVNADEIVITADIPLAAQCVEKGAYVLGPKGRVFTEESIGEAMASREVSSQLRENGVMGGGPAPFNQKDRSRFLERLDAAIHACR
ncbi:MAG: YaiI/YqxD family protein [Candidatus Hydrogenedentota bacterium]